MDEIEYAMRCERKHNKPQRRAKANCRNGHKGQPDETLKHDYVDGRPDNGKQCVVGRDNDGYGWVERAITVQARSRGKRTDCNSEDDSDK